MLEIRLRISSRQLLRLYAPTRSLHHARVLQYVARQDSPVTTSDPKAQATAFDENPVARHVKFPFYFETGFSLFAKRPSRPFPPPFLSPPSGSFSDPLSTHHHSRDRRSFIDGELIRGQTNGDDAVLAGESFVGVADGVGAWSQREKGHAALWSRLILHFWAHEAEKDSLEQYSSNPNGEPDSVKYLQAAFEKTQAATKASEIQGTTTATAAIIHYGEEKDTKETIPILHITNIGDSQILVIRPRTEEVIFKTTEQWHWFDCPRQLGTNSPDTPENNAVVDKVTIEEGDVVVAMSDGVTDNLWEHEVVTNICESIQKWESGDGGEADGDRIGGIGGGMSYAAQKLVKAAKVIAQDPFAESPFMERAIEEGLAMEGGKLDDISVVTALCRRRTS